MEDIIFVTPTLEHKEKAEKFKKSFFEAGEKVIHGSALLDQMTYEEWLQNSDRNRIKETAREDWVQADVFFVMRCADEKFIGIIDIRHSLENEFLREYGGHIGYAVIPAERSKGYAASMLMKALMYLRDCGVKKAMLGCFADNVASIKTILRCDGVLKEKKKFPDGRDVEIYNISTPYHCHPFSKPQDIHVSVPGSKSITNRALLLSALAKGKSVLNGVLYSDDSCVFIDGLKALGYGIYEDKDNHRVEVIGGRIKKNSCEVYVGSAGTAARFLTAMIALSDIHCIVTASNQMMRRPIEGLLRALEELGAEIEYTQKSYQFPLIIHGYKPRRVKELRINIDESSQYLSALLMVAPLYLEKSGEQRLKIVLTGKRTARSYVSITLRMMEQFGVTGREIESGVYEVTKLGGYQGREYNIEPDVSAACYFYAMGVLTGGSALVEGVYPDSMQGDIKFLRLLRDMGCTWIETNQGIQIKAPETKKMTAGMVDMSDDSDQTMTLAAMTPFLSGVTTIKGVGHIRRQESDRLHGIANELSRLGIQNEEKEDGIVIHPGKVKRAMVETYQDHRMAMAFSIVGCMADGIWIKNPDCCRKTFQEFFEVRDSLDKSGFNL